MNDRLRRERWSGVAITWVLWLLVVRGSLASAAPLTITPSLGLAETLTDNVFFDDQDEQDAITRLRLRLSFSYETESSITNLSAGTSLAYRARTSTTEVDLAEAQRLGFSTGYDYSPRLRFSVNDSLGRLGSQARDLQFIDNPLPLTGGNQPIEEDPAGNNPSDVNLILPSGDAFNNSFGISATYLTAPLWSTSVTYTNGFGYFSDRETTDENDMTTSAPDVANVSQTIAAGVGYQYTPTLSLNSRLGYGYFYSNDADDSDNYSLGFGPSWQPETLWRVSALVGGSLNRTISTGRLRGTADVSLNVSRALENSNISAGFRNGFTPSAGVSGTSLTQNVYLAYSRRLTQWLVGTTATSYSRFDTDDNDFDLFIIRTGLFYPIWENVGASVHYSYRRRHADEAATGVFNSGSADANVLSVQITWANPLWQLDL